MLFSRVCSLADLCPLPQWVTSKSKILPSSPTDVFLSTRTYFGESALTGQRMTEARWGFVGAEFCVCVCIHRDQSRNKNIHTGGKNYSNGLNICNQHILTTTYNSDPWSVRIYIFGSVRTWSADWFMKKKKKIVRMFSPLGIWTPRVIYVPCMGKRGSWIKRWRSVGTVVEGCFGIGSRRGRVPPG